MADLIDRAALVADIDEAVVYSGRIGTNAEMRGANKIVDRIKAATAVDAVPVVRCKDCIYSIGDGMICCGVGFLMPDHATFPDHFCYYGERKET